MSSLETVANAKEDPQKPLAIQLDAPAPAADAPIAALADEAKPAPALDSTQDDPRGPPSGPSFPKRKVAILLAYSGTPYHGMQINPNVVSIERVLFDLLCRFGLVSRENSQDVKKVAWMRACRTDKGVSAVGQVVSLKMEMCHRRFKGDDDDGDQDNKEGESVTPGAAFADQVLDLANAAQVAALLASLNVELMQTGHPIKIMDILEMAGSFHSKERCDSRIYEYLVPTFVFERVADLETFFDTGLESCTPESESESEDQELENEGEGRVEDGNDSNNTPNEVAAIIEASSDREHPRFTEFTPTPEEVEAMLAHRITPHTLTIVNSLIGGFTGTHPFHNYTLGKSGADPSAQRFLRRVWLANPLVRDPYYDQVSKVCHQKHSHAKDTSTGASTATAGDPRFYREDGSEWVAIRFHGNSFMLNQIRKMVGLVIWATRVVGAQIPEAQDGSPAHGRAKPRHHPGHLFDHHPLQHPQGPRPGAPAGPGPLRRVQQKVFVGPGPPGLLP